MYFIDDMKRVSKIGWTLVYNGNQYYVQCRDESNIEVYVYSQTAGGFQKEEIQISRQIISQLDIPEMLDQDWIEEGEEHQE